MDRVYIVNFHLTCPCSSEKELYLLLDSLIQFGSKNDKFQISLNYSNRAFNFSPLNNTHDVSDDDEEDE